MGRRQSIRLANTGDRKRGSPRRWLLLLLVAPLLLGLGIAVVSVLVPSGQNGSLNPDRLRADLGRIPYSGGLATTKFTLNVSGEVRVASLTTT
ncbi:MAG: hypothetical protein ACYC4L_18070 [Chloroflexota bacterium]